jgi:hypothetical protein
MMEIMRQLRYCAVAGCAVIILHHPAKTEGSTGRGSTAIKGAVDVAYVQEIAEPNEGGLITLKCIKNRFGETHPITIRPDFEEGTFDVVDSPAFTRQNDDMDKLDDIMIAEPGLSQNQIGKRSGMNKARCVGLLKAGRESRWREVREGTSLVYFSLRLVPKTGNMSRNNGTGQIVVPTSESNARSQVVVDQDVRPVPETGNSSQNQVVVGQGVAGCSPVPLSYREEQGTIPVDPAQLFREQMAKNR